MLWLGRVSEVGVVFVCTLVTRLDSPQQRQQTPPVDTNITTGNVKSYRIVIPDGTYYIYGVMDMTASDDELNDEYNTGILADPDCVLAGTATGRRLRRQ